MVITDGDRSEIDGTAPAALVAGGNSSTAYHFTISRDLVRFIRDVRLPIRWIPIQPNVPHRYRLEIRGAERYTWYIDGAVADSGEPEGAYPTADSRLNFRAKAWYLESVTRWNYIRYGRIPEDASGDYDSDDDRDLFDHYYVQECFSQSGPEAHPGPGCRFADFDFDGDTDLRDFAEFQNRFTGAE
ncbi:MAG: hypothetical protein C4547_11730 [Phycisphaerales bacterium]|nr:MAG: hypothetical protein C4547_11730 [Phycisphaerales bacterium]